MPISRSMRCSRSRSASRTWLRAKRVIYLHLTGSPPNLDVYDYKPELVKRDGQDCPQEFLAGRTFAFTSGTPKLMGTPRKFAQYGQSGIMAVRCGAPFSCCGRRG